MSEHRYGIYKDKIECPFCNNSIEAITIPGAVQASKSSSASAGTKTKWYKSKDKTEIMEGCSKCGKSKSEIQKALKEGVSKPKSKEDLKKQLEELGLLGKFGSNG